MKKFRSGWKRIKHSSCASIMTRLAMIANDISNAYLLLKVIRDYGIDKKPNSHPLLREMLEDSDLNAELRIYAFRMLISHFREGIKVVGEIMKKEATDAQLSSYLRGLSPETLRGYESLKLFYAGGEEEDRFFSLVTNLRDEVGFHYGDKKGHIEKAIGKLADGNQPSVTSIVHTNAVLTTRFPIAHSVVGNIIGMFIWKVERADMADTEEAISTAFKWCNEKCEALLKFSGEMSMMYFHDHYAI